MTATHDPMHPDYLDEAGVRGELTRAFGLCRDCRLCVDLCSSFPTLFEMIDRVDDRDAGRLTPAEQDRVVSECFHCTRCYQRCPYTPERHESALDFPRLMLRAAAMRYDCGHVRARARTTTRFVARTDLVGRAATANSSLADGLVGAAPGSTVRTIMSKLTGVSAVRLLPPYAKQRFSTWFARRPRTIAGSRQERVTVYPTCLVEYQATSIGVDLVRVYERNGIECAISAAKCCGAPWLHSGDVRAFTKVAKKNVSALAAEVRNGTDIVVPQPTCSHVLRHHYVDYVGGVDADLVAAHTHDASEYLMSFHRADETVLDTDFVGEVHASITYHASCHLRAQGIGLPGRDLLELTGARIELVEQCSGTGGSFGLLDGNEDISLPIAEQSGAMIERASSHVVVGDCHLANIAIREQTGRMPSHPLQVIARAYGITDEP